MAKGNKRFNMYENQIKEHLVPFLK